MTWDELSPEQKHDAKKAYLCRLADEGRFIEVVYNGGDGVEEERGPSYEELANADALVPDDVMRNEGVCYVPEDFMSSSPDDPRLFTPEFVHEWCNLHLTVAEYDKDNDKLHTNCDVVSGFEWAKRKLQDLCDRFSKGQLNDSETHMLPDQG